MAKMGMMAALVLVLEGGTVAGTMMLSSGPRKVVADVPIKPLEPEEKNVEVDLVKGTLPNNVSGRLFMYDLQIFAKVNEKDKARATELFAARDAETRDRIRYDHCHANPKASANRGLRHSDARSLTNLRKISARTARVWSRKC